MMNEKELRHVYETLLCVPGMNDLVKIDMKLPRKDVLLLAQVIQKGIEECRKQPMMITNAANGIDSVENLKELMSECLQKAGVLELSQKLQLLQANSK